LLQIIECSASGIQCCGEFELGAKPLSIYNDCAADEALVAVPGLTLPTRLIPSAATLCI
jgi:hypothetical protein